MLTLHAVSSADTIVHDALVDPRVLGLAGESAERIFAGKRGGRPSPQQAEINAILIERARAGRRGRSHVDAAQFADASALLPALHDLVAEQGEPLTQGLHGLQVLAPEGIDLLQREETLGLAHQTGLQLVNLLTRQLHDSLNELGYAEKLRGSMGELPDAQSRLSYIARLTGEAAEKVLNHVDEAKAELRDSRLLRPLFERMETYFVRRFDASHGVEDADTLAAGAGTGAPLLFFAEGTFSARPGLQAFRLGAFQAAARQGLAVVPVALAGTRTVLPDGSWRPRPGPLAVTICAPHQPAGEDWHDLLALRDAVRADILVHCGEDDATRD